MWFLSLYVVIYGKFTARCTVEIVFLWYLTLWKLKKIYGGEKIIFYMDSHAEPTYKTLNWPVGNIEPGIFH